MCYSAQVVQIVRKLHRQLGIRLDYDEAERLFLHRLEDPTVNVSRGFEANFADPSTGQEHRIKAAIDEHRARAAERLERDLFTQRTRLNTATRSLQTRETKKAREDVRIATAKIDTLGARLTDLRRVEPRSRDDRVFPMVYTGVIVRMNGENVLTPMRYFCRPAGKPAFYDKKFPGLYNARRDNLEKFWSGQFGRHHAIMVADSFFENVSAHAVEHRALAPGEVERNVVLQFKPVPARSLLVACLWSHWSEPGAAGVRGFAAITDEPPPAIAAAGHDRCIINLRPEHVDAWLAPEGRSSRELQALLSEPAVSVFEHAVLQAA